MVGVMQTNCIATLPREAGVHIVGMNYFVPVIALTDMDMIITTHVVHCYR